MKALGSVFTASILLGLAVPVFAQDQPKEPVKTPRLATSSP